MSRAFLSPPPVGNQPRRRKLPVAGLQSLVTFAGGCSCRCGRRGTRGGRVAPSSAAWSGTTTSNLLLVRVEEVDLEERQQEHEHAESDGSVRWSPNFGVHFVRPNPESFNSLWTICTTIAGPDGGTLSAFWACGAFARATVLHDGVAVRVKDPRYVAGTLVGRELVGGHRFIAVRDGGLQQHDRGENGHARELCELFRGWLLVCLRFPGKVVWEGG